MTKIIVAKTKLDCEYLLGQFLDENHYDILVEEDTDCYMPPDCISINDNCNLKCNSCPNGTDERRIAFKFRKNYFSKEEQEQAYLGLREAATLSQNRGLAAGPKGEKCGNREWVSEYQHKIFDVLTSGKTTLDGFDPIQEVIDKYKEADDGTTTRSIVWLSQKVRDDKFDFEKWLKKTRKLNPEQRKEEATKIIDTYISQTTYANAVHSGIAGWFDRYPRIPYGRATAYTQHHFDKFQMSFPFLQTLNDGFRELLPKRWTKQREAADKMDPKFLVPGTVFTTITVNKTFRTAAHRDAGDFSEGLSNLLVLSNTGNYTGGYLIFPEYRVAVNVRPGDLLLVNNHEIIHGNTPIVLNDDEAERISLVCYFREKMLELGSYEYENLRFEYVEQRRKNKEHKLWKPLWNGVSESMWNDKEWYDYLEEKGGREMLSKYHPEATETTSTLDSLFS